MLALQIDNVKAFMNHLLLKDTFDSLLVGEAQITTFTTFSIDGQYHPEFFDGDSADENEAQKKTAGTLVPWGTVRPFCLDIIKGKRLPLSFHFVLQLPPSETDALLEENGLNYDPADIFGLFLNVQYRSRVLTLTTGSSLRVFTKDRSLDQAWDRRVREFMAARDLA